MLAVMIKSKKQKSDVAFGKLCTVTAAIISSWVMGKSLHVVGHTINKPHGHAFPQYVCSGVDVVKSPLIALECQINCGVHAVFSPTITADIQTHWIFKATSELMKDKDRR